MNNFIKVNQIKRQGSVCRIWFSTSRKLRKYFNGSVFYVDYFEDISSVPDGLLLVPFVANLLPLVWLTDATLFLPELDSEFYSSLPRIKDGYQTMYKNMSFKGEVILAKPLEGRYYTADEKTAKTALFFSGGCDAVSSLVEHVREAPILMTIWGADIKLSNENGWKNVASKVLKVSKDFNLGNPKFIKSNFRELYDDYYPDILVTKSDDYWWHGFQHGLGLIGLAAPLAYIHNIGVVYIASSFTCGYSGTCASDPLIDNNVRFIDTRIVHDQYGLSRQNKLKLISQYSAQNNLRIPLRVCWLSSFGENCCRCEKCARTIMGLIAENQNPADFGFEQYENYLHLYAGIVQSSLRNAPFSAFFYQEIQRRFQETQAGYYDDRINWIYSLNIVPAKTKVSDRILSRRLSNLKIRLYLLLNGLSRH